MRRLPHRVANGTGVVRVVLDRQAGPVQRSGNGNTVVARDQHRDQAGKARAQLGDDAGCHRRTADVHDVTNPGQQPRGRLGIADHDEHVHATDRTCGTEGRTKRHSANPGGVTPSAAARKSSACSGCHRPWSAA